MYSRISPPAWAHALVAACTSPADYESIAGDLEEEYRDFVQSRGRNYADAWYGSQAIRSVPALLSYARLTALPHRRITTVFIIAIALIAMLFANEFLGDALGVLIPIRPGIRAWPFFLCGWTCAAFFGFLIVAIVRSQGVRLVLIASLALIACIAVPIAMNVSSPLSVPTWLLLLGTTPAMCAGAAVFQLLRRRTTIRR
jgi:hypothetical protein